MKTKIFAISLILTITVSSCGNKALNTTDVNKEICDSVKSVESPVLKPFSNPVFIYGSSFGSFFQTLYKQGKFEEMLKFTSSGSISKYGKEKILNMYKNMPFAYEMKLKSTSGADTVTLNYEAGIYATKHMVRLSVVVENDTAKIILNNIKDLRSQE